MIVCRRATLEDVAVFREVRLRALQESPEAFGSTYETAVQRDLGSWEAQLGATTTGSERNTQLAFDETGACMGLAALYREPSGVSGELLMMWVDPRYRGTSAATQLVENLLRWAQDAGFPSVSLDVTDSNARAIRFYEREGFQSTGETVAIDASRGLTGLRMTRSLA